MVFTLLHHPIPFLISAFYSGENFSNFNNLINRCEKRTIEQKKNIGNSINFILLFI